MTQSKERRTSRRKPDPNTLRPWENPPDEPPGGIEKLCWDAAEEINNTLQFRLRLAAFNGCTVGSLPLTYIDAMEQAELALVDGVANEFCVATYRAFADERNSYRFDHLGNFEFDPELLAFAVITQIAEPFWLSRFSSDVPNSLRRRRLAVDELYWREPA